MPELLIILLIVVIFFGVGRLPELGGAIGKSIREFRKAMTDEEASPRPSEQALPEDQRQAQ